MWHDPREGGEADPAMRKLGSLEIGPGEVVFYLGRLGPKTYWRVQESSGNAMRVRACAETLLDRI